METQEDQEDQAEPKNNEGEQVSVDDIDSEIPLLDQYVSQDGAVTKNQFKDQFPYFRVICYEGCLSLREKKIATYCDIQFNGIINRS